jgi:hypothetical protein
MTKALRNALSAVPGDDLVSAKVRALIKGYDARWSLVQDRFDVIAVEKTLTSQLLNPTTGRISRSFTVAGKLDVIAVRSGRHVIVDHKTTSEDIADPNSPYWRRLIVESQPSHYMLLAWINGMKVDEAIWDVVRKPSIRPKKLSAVDVRTVVFSKEYFGHELTEQEILTLQRDGCESFAMYEARLADDCIRERPDWYFARRSVLRVDSELAEYSKELWDHGQDLLAARASGRTPRNSGACMNYGRPCKFLGVCSGYSQIDDRAEWRRKENVHTELPEIDPVRVGMS